MAFNIANNWLSYGGGVNSTALAILLCEGKLPDLLPFRAVFADTMNEKDETYDFLYGVMMPYLRGHDVALEVCRPYESVIERWERLHVTGSRIIRACSDHAKIRPIDRHIEAHKIPNIEVVRIIGIDAGEQRRAKPAPNGEARKVYPLVDLGMDREDCERVIRDAGLSVPPKSGCWHCQFMKVSEVLSLARERPERMRRVIRLETVAAQMRGNHLCQWNDTPAADYAKRACAERSSGPLFQEVDPDPPCGCYDG